MRSPITNVIPTLTNELKKAAPTQELFDLINKKPPPTLSSFVAATRPIFSSTSVIASAIIWNVRHAALAAAPPRRFGERSTAPEVECLS